MNFYFQQNKTFMHKFKGWTFLLVSEARSIHENSVSRPRAVGQFEKHGLSRREFPGVGVGVEFPFSSAEIF